MTDTTRTRNLEFGLFALAFGLALALRLLRLGELPLNDDEARWALQALDLTRGLRTGMGPQPAYVNLTALVFYILQASNFAARLVPALFGASLSLAPSQFRDRLGSKAAVVLAFLLAIDPGLLGMSRMAGGPLIALCSLAFAWAGWRNGNLRAAGIWAGLALLSGPALWPGVLGLALTLALLHGVFHQSNPTPFSREGFFGMAAYAVGTYLLVGSFFLLAAGGLSAGLSAIPAYFSGWLDFTDVPLLRLVLGLGIYELFPLLLALVALLRGIRSNDELTISLGIWLGVTLVLALAYPTRQVADIAWVLLPVLVLAARELALHLIPAMDGKWETYSMAAFSAAILIFAAINYGAIAMTQLDPKAVDLRWWVILGSLGLLLVSLIMVAFGWSVPVALQGGIWGSLLVLGIYSLSAAMASAGLRTYTTQEMWLAAPQIGQSSTLVSQMNDISRWKAGMNHSLDVSIVDLDSPALSWILRDWPLTVVEPGGGLVGTPSILIASNQFPTASIERTYRGQDISWRIYPAWNQALPADWLRWSILHEMPSGEEKIILWVRADVFPDSQNNP